MTDKFGSITLVEEVKEENQPKYSHNYSDLEVEQIINRHKEILKRDLNEFPVTIQEMTDTIVPFQVITRTKAFNINYKPEKPKKEKVAREPKEPKPKKEKVVKEKKLTKKEITARINELIMKQVQGLDLTKEEQEFYDRNTTPL
jgi:hypothetical protein